MKLSLLMRFFIFLFCTWFITFSASGQSITGIWRGYFITESGDQYKYELQIDQSASGIVHGVSYSYLDTRFYGKAGERNRTGSRIQKSCDSPYSEGKHVSEKWSFTILSGKHVSSDGA